ncbi:MAG: Copper binding protein [Parcubacteria group bacterium GW2011_GWA2_47_8b]|nr:MAG: Copper binding protein [Parcubacteria group bacterium GW2011_GWA2_47_8b]
MTGLFLLCSMARFCVGVIFMPFVQRAAEPKLTPTSLAISRWVLPNPRNFLTLSRTDAEYLILLRCFTSCMIELYHQLTNGLSYSGSTRGWGSCSPGSIPGSPTMRNTVIAAIVGIVIGTGIFVLWRNSNLPPAENLGASVSDIPKDESELKVGEYFDLRGREEVLVSMQNSTFNPRIIIVDKGTKLFWKNEDNAPHSVSFNNKTLSQNESFSMMFDTPGFYPYNCGIHPDTMQGLIIVK